MIENKPLIHTREFRIRHYECDAFGHLNNTNYLRYMQEAAFDGSAAAGYDQKKYDQLGSYWLIRETDIEYLKPVQYGDTIKVKTWVMDFKRVRSRRAYEFIRKGSDEIIARAVTDWVYLDRESGRPKTIPSEISKAYLPAGKLTDIPQRQNFPIAPPPPPGRFEMQLEVTWPDIDSVRHVNNAVYLNYIDNCGMQVIAAHGWPITRMLDEGHAVLIRRHQILYKQPALLGDNLVITTWFSNLRRSTVTRHYHIKRESDGATIAFVHSLGVWVDLKSGLPKRFPDIFLKDFAPNMVV